MVSSNQNIIMSLDDVCDMISFAKHCLSPLKNDDNYVSRDYIVNTLGYMRIDALLLTKHNMIVGDNDCMSNIIFCFDDCNCIFINKIHRYILYYSPTNTEISELIKRFIKIHYSKYKLIKTSFDKIINDELKYWVLCVWFTVVTSKHEHENSDIVIRVLEDEFKDTRFMITFNEMCHILTSKQKQMVKFDFSRSNTVSNIRYHPQNVDKILELLYETVQCFCKIIKIDEEVRSSRLYSNIVNNNHFNKVKKHIKISKTMVHETILKFWNQLDYELKLNIDNINIIMKSCHNIIHCFVIHYRYLIHVYVNLLKHDYTLTKYSITFMELIEEHELKLQTVISLGDDLTEIVNCVLQTI